MRAVRCRQGEAGSGTEEDVDRLNSTYPFQSLEAEAADPKPETVGQENGASPAGLYIHVPFCRSKCPYCDFFSITQPEYIPKYIDALIGELKLSRHAVGCVDSIYFGGGTPSILTPNQIECVMAGLSSCFSISADAEVTLEVNPGTASRNRMADYRSVGINRINIGLQSCADRTLVFLGRVHTAMQGREAYRMARKAGFDNVGLDLIYALPGQSPQQWQVEMAQAVHMAPEHLSCYTLTIEPGTPLAVRIAAGEVTPLDENAAGVLFSLTIDYLNRYGYRQYEISNFARIGSDERVDRRSRHNRKYWNFAPYLGFGPAAHSFLGNKRWWNHPSIDDYLADIHAGRRPVAGEEVLTREQRIIEAVYLGLRQTDGIDLQGFRSTFEEEFGARFEPRLSRLIDGELIEKAPQRIRLTRRGMLFLDKVVENLLS